MPKNLHFNQVLKLIKSFSLEKNIKLKILEITFYLLTYDKVVLKFFKMEKSLNKESEREIILQSLQCL